MPRPTRPAPPPLQVRAQVVVAIGTAVWFVAFVLSAIWHDRLADHGHGEWLWITLAGWVLGLIGLPLIAVQMRSARRRAAVRSGEAGGSRGPADPARAGQTDPTGGAAATIPPERR